MVRAISLFGLLFGVWLLLSGFFSPFFLSVAAACCALVVIIVRRMDRVDGDPLTWSLTFRTLGYIPWLAWQILRANIDVMGHVLRRDIDIDIDPQLEWVPADQESDLAITIYANSITLTPGTISINVEAGRILVHSLTKDGIEELRDGAMNKAVRGIEQ